MVNGGCHTPTRIHWKHNGYLKDAFMAANGKGQVSNLIKPWFQEVDKQQNFYGLVINYY